MSTLTSIEGSNDSNLLKRSYTEIKDEENENNKEEPINKSQRLCSFDSDNEEGRKYC